MESMTLSDLIREVMEKNGMVQSKVTVFTLNPVTSVTVRARARHRHRDRNRIA